MATGSKYCQAEDNEICGNEARALCYHCSRDLCLDHLTQHAQFIDALTRSTLQDYFETLTSLSSHLQSLTISSGILNEPYSKIEQWRTDAYRQIDNIVDKKKQEIQNKINEYRQRFDAMRHEQMQKVNVYKQKIAELFRKVQVSNKEVTGLRKSVELVKHTLNELDQHSIDVIANRPIICTLEIRMRLDDWRPPSPFSSSSLSLSPIIHQLEFRVKYVRLSGIVTSHYVLVEVHRTVQDLIDEFITTQLNTVTNKSKRQCFLVTEISQHRVRRRLTNDILLKTIFNKIDELVLYETPSELHSIHQENRCLILCRFQDGLPWSIKFGLPCLLSLPRFGCRGQDLVDALDKIITSYFPLMMPNTDSHYEVTVLSSDHQTNTTTILNEWANEIIDNHLLMTDDATLIVNVISTDRLLSVSSTSSSSSVQKKQTTHLARLDGTVKMNDKRRKSRK